mgnify:FL=1
MPGTTASTTAALTAGQAATHSLGALYAGSGVAQASLDSQIIGYGSVAAQLGGAAALLRKPKAPGVPRLPPTPSFAADSAAAAERRRKQALAAYGPLSTIKTSPLGLGGPSKIGG